MLKNIKSMFLGQQIITIEVIIWWYFETIIGSEEEFILIGYLQIMFIEAI